MVDAQFANRLLADPSAAIQEFGFVLTEEEQQCLRQIKASNIRELSQMLLERFLPPNERV